jgi:hypothetical protein
MIDTTLSRRHLLAGASTTAAASLLGNADPAAVEAPLLKVEAAVEAREGWRPAEPDRACWPRAKIELTSRAPAGMQLACSSDTLDRPT